MESRVCAVCSANFACSKGFRGKAPKCSGCLRATKRQHAPARAGTSPQNGAAGSARHMTQRQHAPARAGTSPQNGAAGSAPRHMTPCACHCDACRAAGHGNTCVLLRMGLLRLFDGKSDIVDLVLRHYHGSSGWDTARFEAPIWSLQYGPAGDVIGAGDSLGCIHLICAQTGAKILRLKGHR